MKQQFHGGRDGKTQITGHLSNRDHHKRLANDLLVQLMLFSVGGNNPSGLWKAISSFQAEFSYLKN